MTFQTEVDIANRACTHLGVPHIISVFPPDQSASAHEINNIYAKVRDAELQRNLWTFSTRKVMLRALDTTSQLITFEAWASGTTYPAGYVVTDTAGLSWVSLVDGNVGNMPGIAITNGLARPWDSYFGPVSCDLWNDPTINTSSTNNLSYQRGEIVYVVTGAGTYNVYVSLVDNNQQSPTVVDAWSSSTQYNKVGQVVSFTPSGGSLTNYQNKVVLNLNNEPDTSASYWTSTITSPTVSGSWLQLTGATLATQPIVYPLTTGPFSDISTRNAFKLPAGFLRHAPEDPSAVGWLGARSGPTISDVTVAGGYLITSSSYDTGAFMLRFVARMTDVIGMTDMFCEGLAARIAWEISKNVIESPALWAAARADCLRAYNMVMSEARLVDAIELGPVASDEDELITVRY